MLQRATPENCDIFFCYRRINGCAIAREIFNWMDADETRDYGHVYFSDARPDANYINDIPAYLTHAKAVILIVTPDFTDAFPATVEAYRRMARGEGDTLITVTALEVAALMARMLPFHQRETTDRPMIIRVDEECAISLADKPFSLLTSLQTEDDTLRQNLRDDILRAAPNICPRRGPNAMKIDAFCTPHLTFLGRPISRADREAAARKAAAREAAVAAMTAQLPPAGFTILDQLLEVHDDTVRTLSLAELADELIRDTLHTHRVATITGSSGMGKTTQLVKLCRERNAARAHPEPPFFYLPARDLDHFSADPRDSFYTALLKRCRVDTSALLDTADYARENLLLGPHNSGAAPCVLLIDALDEVSNPDNLDYIHSAIRDLAQHGIAVIATSRYEITPGCPVMRAASMQKLKDALRQIPAAYRPAEGSYFARLLQTPLYFTMYKGAVEGSDGMLAIADLAHLDPAVYYHYAKPTTAGELIWNNVMRHLAKTNDRRASRHPEELRDWFFLLEALPCLALQMRSSAGGKNEITEKALSAVYTQLAQRFSHWQPFWDTDSTARAAFSRRSFADGRLPDKLDFLEFCTKKFPLLEKDEVVRGNTTATHYKFVHSVWFTFFTALALVNGICAIACGNADPNARAAAELRNAHLDAATAKMVGELCGEGDNRPFFDTAAGCWRSTHKRAHNLLHCALDALRDGAPLSTPTLINNLFTILKLARTHGDSVPDLSDLDLSGLDLTRCALTNIVFSHIDPLAPDRRLCADFRRTRLDRTVAFSGGHRNSIAGLTIAAMENWGSNRLLSIDETGCAVLWDTEFELPLCVRRLRGSNKKGRISNIVKASRNRRMVAMENVVYTLTLTDAAATHFEVSAGQPLPTRAVNQLVFNPATDSCDYYPFTAPLDRFTADGSPVHLIDGRWMPETVVGEDGLHAYSVGHICISRCDDACADCPGRAACKNTYFYRGHPVPKCVPETHVDIELHNAEGRKKNDFDLSGNPFHTMNLHTVVEIEKWVHEADTWQYAGALISPARLIEDAGLRTFTFADLRLQQSKEGEVLLISLRGKTPTGDMARGVVLQYLLTDTPRLVRRHLLPPAQSPACACQVGADLFSAANLTIFRSSRIGETALFCAGEGHLQTAHFMPDTRAFFTVTDDPVQLQFFSCADGDERRCLAQIIPTVNGHALRRCRIASLAFRFSRNLTFSANRYMQYPDRIHIVLCDFTGEFTTLHLADEQTAAGIPDDIYLVKNPIYSFHHTPQTRFSLEHRGTTMLLQPADPTLPAERIEIHHEWLFAGCDFTDADMGEDSIPAELARYIRTNRAADADNSADIYAEDDTLELYFDEED